MPPSYIKSMTHDMRKTCLMELVYRKQKIESNDPAGFEVHSQVAEALLKKAETLVLPYVEVSSWEPCLAGKENSYLCSRRTFPRRGRKYARSTICKASRLAGIALLLKSSRTFLRLNRCRVTNIPIPEPVTKTTFSTSNQKAWPARCRRSGTARRRGLRLRIPKRARRMGRYAWKMERFSP